MFSRLRDLLLAQSNCGRAGLADVSIGGKTTDRQHPNFTGNAELSQVGERWLWI